MNASFPRMGKLTIAVVVQGALHAFAWTGTAAALPCLEDKFGGKVNCTANDIRITEVSDIVITDDGCSSVDDTVTFNATLTVVTTATARYDIGLFIGEDGTQSLTGECSVFAIPTAPVPPYWNLDADSCGDSSSSATLEVPITDVVVLCRDVNGDNQLDLTSCTSWQQNAAGSCSGAADVTPGTSSKCNCPTTPTDIPIFVPDPVCITNADCEALATGCNVGVCDVANPEAGAFGCVFTPTDSLCDDGQFCNGNETCNDEGECIDGTAPDCDDEIACTTDSCDEAADECTNTPVDDACDDDLFCNGAESCSAELGCQAGTPPSCGDEFACTADSCDEGTDACVNVPNDGACSDGLFCNGAESCSAELGCQAGTPPSCGDALPCTVDSCDEETDACVNTPNDGACDDGLVCNGEERCDAIVGCAAGTAMSCDDGIACTLDACSEAQEGCVAAENDLACDDQNDCTADFCEPATGCEHENLCEAGICRSPGFWGARGGFERNGLNITQAVIDAVGGLEVCGQTVISTSNLASPYLDGHGLDSALEGLCMSTRGVQQRALYRQLIAATLNCAISGSADCDATVGIHTDASFDECNSLCAGEDVGVDGPTIGECISELDCYNNGGEVIGGECALGTCSVTGELCGADAGGCPDVNDLPQGCDEFPGNCHDAEFCQEAIGVCPGRLGPASSSKACNEARRNDCTIDACD